MYYMSYKTSMFIFNFFVNVLSTSFAYSNYCIYCYIYVAETSRGSFNTPALSVVSASFGTDMCQIPESE